MDIIRRIVYLIVMLIAISSCNGDAPPFSENNPYHLPNGAEFEYTFYDANGNAFNLNSFNGKVVIIVFVATWCPACPSILKRLARLKNENIENLEIISLVVGDEKTDAVQKYQSENGAANLTVYASVPAGYLKTAGLPTILIFDKGKPVCGYVGVINILAPEFITFLKDPSAWINRATN
jgi:thiol-disulfide isomerase/thioredoxin